ncbi:MAG: coenzyme F420-0:L-glutamate ligase [Vallitaleaceae bacterium]|nr:coenzyme F420-0:L-glutamate ligase [Vallitaleaceae bacterium]
MGEPQLAFAEQQLGQKSLERTYNNESYLRLPIKTCLIDSTHNIIEIVQEYTRDVVEEGDIIFISEKAVAITEGRAYPIGEVKPRKLAITLSKYVTKTPHGIGLGIPETMEMALRECGVIRILFAAFCSAIGKVFKKKGIFYIIAGKKAAGIDGPTEGTIPPYDGYVVLGPKNPKKIAKEISAVTKTQVAIVDINDLGGVILGTSHSSMNKKALVQILRDNPLGQSTEQTPIGIIRKQ